jgi:glucose-1-phosphate cytidylyltransferase
METILLAGGRGSRIEEESASRPKPMVEIGGRPILWHIMKGYAHHGFKEFAVALGYKGESIKAYFLDYADINSDLTVDLKNGRVERRRSASDDWTIQRRVPRT